MSRFAFSADGHVVEPSTLFLQGLPPSLREYGIRAEKQDDAIVLLAGSTPIQRTRLNRPKPAEGSGGETLGRPNLLGARDLDARLVDLKGQGIDAEICFPSLGLWTFLIENAEAGSQAHGSQPPQAS